MTPTVRLLVWKNEKRIWWSAVVGVKGRKYIAKVEAIGWQTYKSEAGAMSAGMKACKRLFPTFKIVKDSA